MMQNLHILDTSIIFIFLFICLTVGFLNVKGIKNIRDYTIGSRYLSTPLLVGTLFATHIGAGFTVGRIEKIYSLGIIFVIITLLDPLIWLTTYLVFSRRINEFRTKGCISLSDVMEVMYGKTGRWITNIAAKMMCVTVTSMQIIAIGYLLSYFLGVTPIQGALLGFGILVLYSVLGGIKAVVITDAVQSAVLYIGIPAACLASYYDVGGYDALVAALPETHTNFEMSYANISLLISLAIWAWMPHTNGTFMQRFLMFSSKEQFKVVIKVLFFGSFPIALVTCLIALIVKVKAPDINPNTAFFYLIDHYLPIGVKGLVITGILAAIMSTADSWLNTASVLWAHDICKKLFPKISDFQEVLIARISLIVVAVLATFLAFYKSESILALNWIASSFWEPIIFIPLMMGFLGFKTHYRVKAFTVASITGCTFTIIAAYLASKGPDLFAFDTVSMCIGLIGSFIGLFGTHYIMTFKKSINKNYDKNKMIVESETNF